MVKPQLPSIEEVTVKQNRLMMETTSQPIDFAIESLYSMVNRGLIDLDPEFQRRTCWNTAKNSKLIESFLLNIPIPPLFFMTKKDIGKYYVIDGQQRIRAITSFFNNGYRLSGLDEWSELNGLNFADLEKISLADVLKARPLRTFVLTSSSPDAIYDIFSRLNTGGVVLNAQEIRNATYAPYPFNKVIKKLGDDPQFWKLVGIKDKNSAAYRSMYNCELVLRYFAFRDEGYKNFKHSYIKFLNAEMDRKILCPENEHNQFISDFKNTLSAVEAGLGRLSFRNPDRVKTFIPIVYEMTMHAFNHKDPEKVRDHSVELQGEYIKLWKNEEFTKLLGQGTNTPQKVASRIELMDSLVKSIVD